MRPDEFAARNRLKPGRIKNPSRYVMGRLYSHRRPAMTPADLEPDDNPVTRGLTRETHAE